MEQPRLVERKPPERYLRSCGHPVDWTLDLLDMDNIIISYCMGCVVEKAGLQPVAKHKMEDGKLVKIWGE